MKMKRTGKYKFIDMTGQTFGKWNVLEKDIERGEHGETYWLCKCECGNTKSILGYNLRKGFSTECLDCRKKN